MAETLEMRMQRENHSNKKKKNNIKQTVNCIFSVLEQNDMYVAWSAGEIN